MATSLQTHDKHDQSEKRSAETVIDNGNDQKRHSFYATAALLGGVISVALAIPLPHTTLFYQVFTLIAGIAWLVMAGLYKFSDVATRKLHHSSFVIIESQFITTNLIFLLITQFSLPSFLAIMTNTLLVLMLLIIISFILFSAGTAAKVSTINAAVTIGLIFIRASFFTFEDRLFVFSQIVEPTIYVAIAIYLARALALFQNDAMLAKNQADHYEVLAFYDPLTSVANRRMISNELQKEIAVSQRYNLPLSIMIFDIDHFKSVNDTYGHNFGDQVLKSVANNVNSQVRSADSFGRWGGEEFLCVMPNTTAKVAFELAERLREGIEHLTFDNGSNVTASFGIAQLIEGDDFDSLVNRADKELYAAKENGRNCCEPVPIDATDKIEGLSVELSIGQVQQLH